jgi:hypothetical protein
LNHQLRIGYAFWQNGYKKEAEYWFKEQIKLSQESIKLGRAYSTRERFGSNAYYDLAGVYAFKGEKARAIEILRGFDCYHVISRSLLDDLKKYNPLFNSIRDDPEFQKIVSSWESKYQAEHERVRKWMEENGQL